MGQWIETNRGIIDAQACDAYRHMTVKGYFELFGNASNYLLQQVGLHYSDTTEIGYGVATIMNTIRFRHELVDGNPYVIEGAFVRLGRSSFRYVQKMTNVTTGEFSASYDATEVLFFLEARDSAPLTTEMRSRIESMLIELVADDREWFGQKGNAA